MSLHSLPTQSKDVDEGSGQNLGLTAGHAGLNGDIIHNYAIIAESRGLTHIL